MNSYLRRNVLPVLSGFLILVTLISTAHAILDTNQNSLSDVWEETYNDGALFSPSITASQDPDGDGWTNEQEAAAGTNPFEANPPDGIIQPVTEHIPATYLGVDQNGDPAIITPATQTITWPTLVGKLYTLQFSPNLAAGTWQNVGTPILGNGDPITIANTLTQPDGNIPEELFWKLVTTDVDEDYDGLTNAEEHELGTDPLNYDTDSDGLPDGWEMVQGLNPADNGTTDLNSGPNGDPDGDGLNNLYEYWYGVDPHLADTDGDALSDWDEIVVYFTSPILFDSDEDNLGDFAEIFTHNTDPWKWDTDQDYLSDGDEILIFLTNPLATDTDGDWMRDDYELANTLDPTDPADGLADADGDTLVNRLEFVFLDKGFDPVIANNAALFPWAGDQDGDESTTFQEFTVHHTHPRLPDTDGDLMPDGWEISHGLNPRNANDANLDGDADGLTNLNEYRHNTDPASDDTDGDGTNDGPEVNGPDGDPTTDDGSHPGDNRDDGEPIPGEEKTLIVLGVGDQSASHSEDYVMNVFRVDLATGVETRIYTLRSGGFGQYKEETRSFRKGDTLTFQIDWQSSKNPSYSSAGNPDFDYTFKVQPQGGDYAARLVPYYDPELGTTIPGVSLLGQKNDVTDFLISTERMRALLQTAKIDLAMDTNMNGVIESLPDGVKNLGLSPVNSSADRDLSKAKPDYGVIVDVNNNNTDADNATSPTKAEADHANSRMDTQADREEIDDPSKTISGHAFGRLRIWANPVLDYGMSWGGGSGQLAIRLKIVEAGGDQIIRIYDWQSYEPGQDKPEALIQPGKASVDLNIENFFKESVFGKTSDAKNWYRDLAVEGLTYGQVTLRFEVIEPNNLDNPNNVIASDEVKVTVNVDQFTRTGADLTSKKDAVPLRGEGNAPHYSGIFDLNTAGTNGDTRAIRGRIIARVPSANIGGWATQLTPMRGRKLREKDDGTLNTSSGQSIWVGLKQQNGADLQWVQCGLRWYEKPLDEKGTPPFAYLEDGTFIGGAGDFIRRMAAPGNGSPNDGGLVRQNASPLQGWESERLVLDFILYKLPVSTNSTTGADAVVSPWKAIFRDARSGKSASDSGNYISLEVGVPAPNVSNPAVQEAFETAYKSQKLTILDAKHETNLSIAFAPGLSGAEGGAANLQTAATLASGISASSRPPDSNPANLWSWLDTAWSWNATTVTAGNVKMEVRSGGENGAVGTTPHPYWQVQGQANGFQLWDTRAFGFGATN